MARKGKMGPTRAPYGSALGFVNHFNYRGTTAGDISGSSTPNVTIGELFYTNNTGSVTLTDFTLDDTANRSANYEGKLINVIFLDTATQIANGGTLYLQGSDNLAGSNHGLTLMYSRGNWYEISRWKDNQNGGIQSFTGAGTTSINVNDVDHIMFNGTAATVLQAFSGGQVGQYISISHRTNGVTLTVNTAGNILIAATNAVVIRNNDAWNFIKVSGSNWIMMRCQP
jgi:hypothetical protein